MTLRRIIELAACSLALLIAVMAIHAWLASRDEQQRLATTLAQQKQLLDAADTRERTRQSALDQTLAQIENLKRATQTPQQIVSSIPQFLSLPQPITLTPAGQGIDNSNADLAELGPGASGTRNQPGNVPSPGASSPTTLPSGPSAQIPTADLKPLFDYIQDCRACQAQLAAAKQNATDDASKIAALTSARDAALTASKGGTFLRRLRRNALWFAVGAAASAATYRVSHH